MRRCARCRTAPLRPAQAKYCSIACRCAGLAAAAPPREATQRCAWCRTAALRPAQAKYCSIACRNAAAAAARRHPCAMCGGDTATRAKYCSAACRARHRAVAPAVRIPHECHSAAFYARVAELWDAGLSLGAIGAKLGVSRSTIAGIRRRRGLPPRKSPIPRRVEAVAPTPVPVLRRTPPPARGSWLCSAHPAVLFHPPGWHCAARERAQREDLALGRLAA